jgi:dTDP-D-glucose 4,6-dehydratase
MVKLFIYQLLFQIAQIIMGLIIFPEKLIPLFINNIIQKNHYQFMEMANIPVTGSM